ncbi:MAG: SapC family protein [Burkholderiales bacterium]|nr:SapC family protein [Burkholderiales bacterium]
MINSELHKQPQLLDRGQHRQLRMRTDVNSLAAARPLNSVFLTAAEFGDACKEFPILFLRAGEMDGKPQVAAVAVLGLSPGENLMLETTHDGGDRWTARYIPALLRAYPFTMARTSPDQWAVAIDRSWKGLSETEGERLFDDQGEPTTYLNGVREFVERLEAEIERTRQAGERLLAMGLLQEKRFDATLPDGQPLVVDGFLAIDEQKYAELSDAEVLELHRGGLAGVLMTHQVSLGNMRALIERRLARGSQPAGA